jgi:formylglycine-generating enzyme required for sulfatase activity
VQRVPIDDFSPRDARVLRPRFGRSTPNDPRAALEAFPQDLLRGLLQGRGLLFVGPGVSRSAGLTVRETLREAMCNALRHHVPLQDASELEAFLRQASPPEVAQVLHDQLGRDAWLRFLQDHLSQRDIPPPPLLYALRALPCRIIVTTNVDRLLERTFENPLEDQLEAEVIIPAPGMKEPIPDPSRRAVLVKLFGDLFSPESLVLTTDDYESYFRARPELVARLKALLEVGPALFVGYHVRDPEFRRLYSQVGALLARAHKRAYAIADGLNRFEAEWWGQRALTVLTAPGIDSVDGMLRELSRQLQRQSHPGLEVETDGSPLAVGAPAAGSRSLNGVLQAQIEYTARTWLIPGPRGPIDLRAGYMPLGLRPEGGPGQAREQRLPTLLADPRPEEVRQLRAPLELDVATALDRTPRAVVLGPAGSGKTTLLLHLLLTRSEAALEAGDRTLVAYLPLRFMAGAPTLSLMECLVDHLQALVPKEPRDLIETAVIDALIEGRALLLLDGLDEIEPDEVQSVLERLGSFIKDCPKVRLVLTCRSGAFEAGELPADLELAAYEVSSLTPEQQNAFIRDRLRNNPAAAESLIALLQAGIAPWAERLATNPLHLSQICLKYNEDGRFAESRSALYVSYMGILLRMSPPGEENSLYAYDKELILQAIALYAMTHPREPLTGDQLNELAEQEMSLAHIAPRKDVNRRVEPRDAIREIVSASGVLVGPNARKVYEFRHSAIKEYLAARRLMALREGEAIELFNQHAGDQRWAGVWRLTTAMADDATPFLERLESSQPARGKLLSRCFGEARRVQAPWLSRKLGDGASHPFGQLLSRLKDQLEPQEALDLFGEILWKDQEIFLREGHRTDARALYVALSGLHRMIEAEGAMAHQAAETIASWRGAGEHSPDAPWPCAMVDVPGGIYLSGTSDGGTSHYVELAGFQIGRDPVTIAQFQAFNPSLELDGLPRAEEFQGSSHPIVNVSWFDAWVCARWYSCRLPSEAEWEKAAGWDPATQARRTFPWGDDWDASRCNSLETWNGEGHTTPVDRYAGTGDSAYGARDMAGNVFEWTRDQGPGSLERRVLKGGSWQASPLLLRVTASIALRPGYKGPGVGFRLARSL